jgi:membrane associated rhomboid family serine protease
MSEPTHDDDPELVHAPTVLARFRRALNLSLATVVALCLVFFVGGEAPAALTVQPQKLAGLVGVLTAPLLHGSVEHLAANSLSILILGTLAGTVFPRATLRALPLLWLGAGLGTWLIGTGGYHLGASGVTHGLGYLIFTLAALRRDRASIAAALIAFFFFGGMVLTVLPQEMGVSWESHLSGALAGIAAGLWFRRADPIPPRRKYSWEEEPAPAGPDDLEPRSPDDVPVIWRRAPSDEAVVLRFRPRRIPVEPATPSETQRAGD